MPSGATAKRLLIVVGLTLVALALVGLVFGAVGSAILDKDPFVPQPEIHLAPQPIFPGPARDLHLGLASADTPGEGHGAEVAADGSGEAEEAHSTPLGITEFAVTNTLLSAWFASIVLILFFVLGARKKSLVPGRLQGVVEVLFEGVLNFSASVLGPEMARKAFPIVATIFFFVLFNAWLGLLPFYQFLGFVDGENQIKVHLLRAAGTDLNMPLALSLISFCFVEYWGFRVHGFGYLTKFFAFGSLFRRGLMQGLIDMFVGFLEFASELVRLVSFTFRLFGNMTAGEILVVMITFLVPFVLTNFVYGLELLVGLIQSVIFAGLTLVFLSVAVRHQEH